MDEEITDQLQPFFSFSHSLQLVASYIHSSIVRSTVFKLLDTAENRQHLLSYAWLTSLQIISPVVSIALAITRLDFFYIWLHNTPLCTCVSSFFTHFFVHGQQSCSCVIAGVESTVTHLDMHVFLWYADLVLIYIYIYSQK